jgi:hypothetical protein
MTPILSGIALAMLVALTGQRTFSSAEEAGQALAAAVQTDDRRALTDMLGPDTDLIATGDDSVDQADRHVFVEKYQQMHRLVREADGIVVLYIGAENWPFPVPLASKAGRWYFDVDAGKNEVVMRRIGENEIEAMDVSLDLIHDHAPGLVSPTPSHGYYYRVVNRAVVAYPAEYRSSGVMTFLVTPDGVVYQRDLGPHTETIAAAMRTYVPRRPWQRVE